MTDQNHTYEAYGGVDGYRTVHEALSRALAEPSAQGDHAHGARAGFLLAQIAPQIRSIVEKTVLQSIQDAGAPTELLSQLAPYLSLSDAVSPQAGPTESGAL